MGKAKGEREKLPSKQQLRNEKAIAAARRRATEMRGTSSSEQPQKEKTSRRAS